MFLLIYIGTVHNMYIIRLHVPSDEFRKKYRQMHIYIDCQKNNQQFLHFLHCFHDNQEEAYDDFRPFADNSTQQTFKSVVCPLSALIDNHHDSF